ncbi:60S ribosomal protein L41 [Mauremys reevesii]|uniref:60S ribosomal protein L41 n=1 Tax=Mauremys reevesii TaxID=260615 RepID=UPI001940024C|nr:60S ribosomal protein L41 [Mauremys reevesii]
MRGGLPPGSCCGGSPHVPGPVPRALHARGRHRPVASCAHVGLGSGLRADAPPGPCLAGIGGAAPSGVGAMGAAGSGLPGPIVTRAPALSLAPSSKAPQKCGGGRFAAFNFPSGTIWSVQQWRKKRMRRLKRKRRKMRQRSK